MADEDVGVSGLAGRCATALFDLAEQDGALDAVAADLASVRAMLDQSADLRRLMRSPVIARDDQGRGVAAVLDAAGAATLTKNFFGVLARNRRLFATSDVIRAFETLLAAHRGEVRAEVTSAATLDDAQVAAITDALKKAVGRDILLGAKVDTGLLGGLVVKVGSRMVDSSLRTKLQALKLAMKGVG